MYLVKCLEAMLWSPMHGFKLRIMRIQYDFLKEKNNAKIEV
jgi:hypothetical protein